MMRFRTLNESPEHEHTTTSAQTMMIVEVRHRNGSTLESEGTPIYEVLNGAYIGYRGTYEQLSTVADVEIRFTDFLSIDAESSELLVRHQLSNTWHSLNALESSEAVRTIETDIQLVAHNINAVIYRLEQEQPDFEVIGAMAQAYGWVEQAQKHLPSPVRCCDD